MIFYSEPDGHIRDKVKVVIDLLNYATKKELDHATEFHTSGLAAKKYFIPLKAGIDKIDVNKLVNVPTTNTNKIFEKNSSFHMK